MKKLTLLFLTGMILWIGCGGGASDNPPDIEGLYDCVSGCFGDCEFSSGVEVQQTGDQILVDGTSTGDVDNDGNFSFSDGATSCVGQFADNTAEADCVIDGAD